MAEQRVWLLNLDADDELARPDGYAPSRALRARTEALAAHLAALVGADLRITDDVAEGLLRGQGAGMFAGRRAMAWSPTLRAQKILEASGARLDKPPPFAVLRAVNHRKFNASLGQTLPGARFVRTKEEVLSAIVGPSPTGMWLMKRPFGYAGRGRLKIDGRRAEDVQHAEPWIDASLRSAEGLQVEPFVDRLADFGLHGLLRPNGDVVVGEPTRQACDDSGAWQSSVRADPGDLLLAEREALFEETLRAATALRRVGYFGPFGVDAFRWRDPFGRAFFNARGEINARYSMGWAAGMGESRPDLSGAGV